MAGTFASGSAEWTPLTSPPGAHPHATGRRRRRRRFHTGMAAAPRARQRTGRRGNDRSAPRHRPTVGAATVRIIRGIADSGLVPDDELDLLPDAFLAAGRNIYWEPPADWFDGPEIVIELDSNAD